MRLFKNLFKKKIVFLIHSGDFHADDVFAAAAFSIWAEKRGMEIIVKRSRDEKEMKIADIVADVGNVYDPNKNRFDHHQKGGAGKRENGIPYASFGLIWKKYGEEICGSREIADRIEKKIVMPIDARDNGLNILIEKFGVAEYSASDSLFSLNLSWIEKDKNTQKYFEKALYFAKEILGREVIWARAEVEGEKETQKIIEAQNNPEILILDKEIEWEEAASKNGKIKFIVYPRLNEKEWCIQSGTDDLKNFNSKRATFPESWRGLKGNELAMVSGVGDAIFCTNGGWFAAIKSKEGAVEMAEKALQMSKI